MTMVDTFKKKYEVGTIIHDGFLVQSTDVKDEVLRSAEQSVKDKYGYDIALEKKDLTDFEESALWGADDDGEGLREAAQDVVRVLDGHRDENAAEGLPDGREPREGAEA